MSDISVHLDRLKRQAGALAAKVRPHHLAMGAALAVIGVGVVTMRAVALPGPQPIRAGERLQIQVVAPAEPEILPGSVMEVGDLVTGFEYRPRAPSVIESAVWAPYDEDSGGTEPRPKPRRYDDPAGVRAPPPPEPPPEGWRETRVGRWFGFDQPERDYRAEREARRARIEARMERDRERREVRWYRSDGEPAGGDDRHDLRRQDGDPDDLRG